MTYAEYLKFYDLKETEDTYSDWLHNEWRHGRAFLLEGEFYRTDTGEKLCSDNKTLSLTDRINSAALKVRKSLSDSKQNFESRTR